MIDPTVEFNYIFNYIINLVEYINISKFLLRLHALEFGVDDILPVRRHERHELLRAAFQVRGSVWSPGRELLRPRG